MELIIFGVVVVVILAVIGNNIRIVPQANAFVIGYGLDFNE